MESDTGTPNTFVLEDRLNEVAEPYSNNMNDFHNREALLQILQNYDCRNILVMAQDNSVLAGAFRKAGIQNEVNILRAFLENGMNVNIKHHLGSTTLLNAAYFGHKEAVGLLLDHNADVDIQNNVGWTALMWTSERGWTNIVKMFLEKNANPDLQNNIGMTTLMIASSRGHKEIVQLLLNPNADISLTNKDGKTAFDLAKNDNTKEMLQNHVSNRYVLK